MSPPSFDAVAFAAWLRRWRDAENLEWGEIARRSGLHYSTLMHLARGGPDGQGKRRGQKELNPGITTIARLAQGLGLEFGYVASKGGLFGGNPDRWDYFNQAERELLAAALLETTPPPEDEAVHARLLGQLEPHITITEERIA